MSKPEGWPDIDSLYLDGALYDRTFRVDMDLPWPDQRFWARQAERYGKQVLELGSGTGRVAVPWPAPAARSPAWIIRRR